MNTLWMIGIWGLFLWYGVIAGTAPVILLHRLRCLWRERNNPDFARRDNLSLVFFDIGIIGVTGWLLYITIQYVQAGNYGFHAWNYLLLIHLWSGCFAIGLILRTALWTSSWGVKHKAE